MILAVLWIGCAISALSGENGWAVFLGVVAGIGTLVHLLSVCAIQNLKGKPLVIAGPEGLWTTQFALPWSNVRAFEFIEKPATHNGGDPRLTTAARYVCESLLVTSNEFDASGRCPRSRNSPGAAVM
ncbi:hypothetical protein CQY22_010120 [Mycolicibacterium brumae]|uniref:Uncharacterized protein n=1 Tax=Mycolicibacterium brumae TaxID=85968 RepID=A0A2G5PA37_9MYCO|nr:hypothetical protein CQY22_010120 [Mycolicibacterium brumae]RWA23542.1 hypothetical protein MBRU_01575 [Mycolicibacterium brumae DSM 44177]